jgi:hypothetical protein
VLNLYVFKSSLRLEYSLTAPIKSQSQNPKTWYLKCDVEEYIASRGKMKILLGEGPQNESEIQLRAERQKRLDEAMKVKGIDISALQTYNGMILEYLDGM